MNDLNPCAQAASRRLWLWRLLLGSSTLWSARLLAATEESPETESNWEGPFYKPGAPMRSLLLEPGMAGTPLRLSGRVLDVHGRPLAGASPPTTRAATHCAPSSRFTTVKSMTSVLPTSM